MKPLDPIEVRAILDRSQRMCDPEEWEACRRLVRRGLGFMTPACVMGFEHFTPNELGVTLARICKGLAAP